MGLGFIIISFIIKKGEGLDLIAGYNTADEEFRTKYKKLVAKMGGMLFFTIGFLTALMGILAVIYNKELTKSAVQIGAIIYLIFLFILLLVFVITVNKGTKKVKNEN